MFGIIIGSEDVIPVNFKRQLEACGPLNAEPWVKYESINYPIDGN